MNDRTAAPQCGKEMRRFAFLVLGTLVFALNGLNGALAQTPTFQAAGAAVTGTASVTPAWPAHAVDDVALLFVESTGGQAATLSTANGFAAVLNSPQSTGGGATGTRITVFWARATSTMMASPVVADPGNHVYAQILTYRSVFASGNPWDVTGGGTKGAASMTVTVTGVTTTVDSTLIVQAVARDDDLDTAEFSAQTNVNLTSITERSDAGTLSGNGGGFAVWDGGKATAGATGNTTATIAVSTVNAFLTIALRPNLTHYAITGSTTALTCEPTPVTFTGHNAAHAAAAPPLGSVITLATGSTGLWEATLVAGTGTWSPSGLNNGVATYAWPGGETFFTARLRQSIPATLAVNASDNFGVIEDPTEDLSITYSNAAFRFINGDGSNGNLPNQVAGTTSGTLHLQAVQGSCVTPGACAGVCTTASVGDFSSGATTSVDLAFESVNPTTFQAGQTLAFVNNGSTNIAGNPNGAVATYTAKSLTWGANGVAAFTMNYSDVGQLRLHTRWPAGGPAEMSGASAPFVVRPFGFTISNIIRTSDSFANPAAADATGTAFIRAGQPFTLTVTAINQSSVATPNYGKETAPEGVLLTPALVAGLGLTAIPALGNNTIAGTEFGAGGAVVDANGVATVTNINWGEVGIITITPSVGDGDYLGAGNTTGTTTGNVGRFFPDHFALTGAPTLTNRAVLACAPASTFSYMGEGMNLVFSLRAENLANSVTQNYRTSGVPAQNFAKLSAASTSAYNFGARSGVTNLTGRISSLYPGSAPMFVDGVLALTAGDPVRMAVGRNNTGPAPQDNPDGPYAATAFGIAPVDSDTVAMGTLDLDVDGVGGNDHTNLGVSTELRFGRLRLTNAVGSEKLALQVPMQTQHWSSAGFITNTDDSCTTFARSAIVLDGYTGAVAPGGGNCKTFVQQDPITFSSGVGTLTLAAPTSGATGTLRLTPNLGTVVSGSYCDNASSGEDPATAASLSYLFGRWDDATTAESPDDANTAQDDNPRARAAFGIYGAQPRNFIFFRENY